MKLFVKRVVLCLALSIGTCCWLIPAIADGLALQDENTQQTKAPAKAAKASPAKPDALFRQNCARCHGADGRGETPLGKIYSAPNLVEAEWQKRFSDKELNALIAHGKSGMPAFDKKLSKKQISALVTYVRRFK
jgi:mono/diheme cytochrome c family protein